VESLGLKRATYLTAVCEAGRIDYDITAETFPADRDFLTCKSSEMKQLLVNIILEKANERYTEQTLTFDDEKLDIKVLQIRLPESNVLHILILTSAGQDTKGLRLSEDDKKVGLKYLAKFAETTSTMIKKT
jgi:hypothetical protein